MFFLSKVPRRRLHTVMAQCSVENMQHFEKHKSYNNKPKLSKKKKLNVKGSANVKFAKVDGFIRHTGYNLRGQGSAISGCYDCLFFFCSAPAGSLQITWQEIMVGVESGLLMFPINILIITIFRSIRPRIVSKSKKGNSEENLRTPAVTVPSILKVCCTLSYFCGCDRVQCIFVWLLLCIILIKSLTL